MDAPFNAFVREYFASIDQKFGLFVDLDPMVSQCFHDSASLWTLRAFTSHRTSTSIFWEVYFWRDSTFASARLARANFICISALYGRLLDRCFVFRSCLSEFVRCLMSWGLLCNFRRLLVRCSSVSGMLHRVLLLNVESLVLKCCLLDLSFHWLMSVKASLIGFFGLVFLIFAMIGFGIENLRGCDFFTFIVLVGCHIRFFLVWSKPNLRRCVVRLGLLKLFNMNVVGTLLLLCSNMIEVIKFVLIFTYQRGIRLLILRIDVEAALRRNTCILETLISVPIKLCLRLVTLWFLWVNQKLALRMVILKSFFRLEGVRDTILDSWTESIFTWIYTTCSASSW